LRVTGTANTARWIETNFSSRSKRAIVNQYSGAPVHACPDFAMSRGNYLWEQCGTVQLLSRASELSNVHPRDTRIFNLAVTVTATTNSTGWFAVFVKKNEGLAALGNSPTAHASRLSIFSKLFWQPFKHTLRLEDCERIREHPPQDFHYQRQRRREPPCCE